MAETIHRVLRLLTLLQARAVWRGDELAQRLGVTPRTVRRDVERLRSMGYPVEGERGLDGGYRLGAGTRLPPLVLDDDEAVALVACLRMGALDGADGVGEAALRALAKLDQVLPARHRASVRALDATTTVIGDARPEVDWRVLQALARAARERVRVRFEYTSTGGSPSHRDVEPARLLTQGRLWYLQAFDRGRDDWRTFRIDRLADLHVTTFSCGRRGAPPEPLFGGGLSGWPCIAVVRIGATADRVLGRIPPGHCEVLGEDHQGTRIRTGAGAWDDLAWYLAWVARDLAAELTVEEPDELRQACAAHALRFARAAGAGY